MKCPTCNIEANCIDSRPMPNNMRRRRYACECGLRFNTLEVLQIDTDDLNPGKRITSLKWIDKVRKSSYQEGRNDVMAEMREILGIKTSDPIDTVSGNA